MTNNIMGTLGDELNVKNLNYWSKWLIGDRVAPFTG